MKQIKVKNEDELNKKVEELDYREIAYIQGLKNGGFIIGLKKNLNTSRN